MTRTDVPVLHNEPPLPPRREAVIDSPFWIGSAADASYRLQHPGVRPRHAALVEREDGFWLIPGDGASAINGRSVTSGVRLSPGDRIELASGCALRFGEKQTAPPPQTPRSTPTVHGRRRSLRDRLPRWHASPRVTVLLLLAVMTLGTSVALVYRALTVESRGRGDLTLEQELVLDSLLREAYDRIERGNALLEIGANDAALREFADGINVVQLHPLHTHPSVARTVLAMEASVATLYRTRRLVVPPGFSAARADGGSSVRFLSASLSVDEFGQRFAEVAAAFRQAYGDSVVVTGRDHPEHLSLYGQGGAIDLRSRDLAPDRVQFLVRECARRGIRVKDFSTDQILRAQVAAAVRAGLPDRASTGLHLHIDRFAGRRDRWTVTGSP